MKVDDITSPDVYTNGGGETPPSAGLASNALPEAQCHVAKSSQTGVSTKNAHLAISQKDNNLKEEPHWYALRTTYGREQKAYDFMVAKGVTTYVPSAYLEKCE